MFVVKLFHLQKRIVVERVHFKSFAKILVKSRDIAERAEHDFGDKRIRRLDSPERESDLLFTVEELRDMFVGVVVCVDTPELGIHLRDCLDEIRVASHALLKKKG